MTVQRPTKSKKSKNGKSNFALELDLPHYLKWPQRAETAVLTPQREERSKSKAKKERSKRRKADEIEGDSYSKFSSHKFVSASKGLQKRREKSWFVQNSKKDAAENTADSGDSLETKGSQDKKNKCPTLILALRAFFVKIYCLCYFCRYG